MENHKSIRYLFGPLLISAGILIVDVACLKPSDVKTASDVTEVALSAAQVACIFGSALTDEAAVAKACGIVSKLDKLLPLIRDLIGQREGAKAAGVMWHPADAGATDASVPKSDASTSKDAAKE